MDRYGAYGGKRSAVRRRRRTPSGGYGGARKSGLTKGAARLTACVALFAAAALLRFAFPTAFEAVGEKINAAVDYRSALTVLGEGLSGEKKFLSALSEAATYAFTGRSGGEQADGGDQAAPDAAAPEDAAQDAAGDGGQREAPEEASLEDAPEGSAAAAFAQSEDEAGEGGTDFAGAIVSAFLDAQEVYSDYSIPAGVTYGMPRIGIDYDAPVEGVVSSPFGYRVHPETETVRFHFGTDIAAQKGTAVGAFADGKVIAAGENVSLGQYVIINHGDVETQYAHCDKLYVVSGQTVHKGEKIASVGDSGNATDCCLHFEMKVNGVYVNPEYYVQWL